jgi:hypothetical protein
MLPVEAGKATTITCSLQPPTKPLLLSASFLFCLSTSFQWLLDRRAIAVLQSTAPP